jgi:hypothetical protein
VSRTMKAPGKVAVFVWRWFGNVWILDIWGPQTYYPDLPGKKLTIRSGWLYC